MRRTIPSTMSKSTALRTFAQIRHQSTSTKPTYRTSVSRSGSIYSSSSISRNRNSNGPGVDNAPFWILTKQSRGAGWGIMEKGEALGELWGAKTVEEMGEWQKANWDMLNKLTKGTELENSEDLVDTIVKSSSLTSEFYSPSTFHYASLLLNNSFFVSNLTSNPKLKGPPSSAHSNLLNVLEMSFKSVSSLQTYFTNAALGIESEGFLWVVWQGDNMGVVFTPRGTMLVQGRKKRGEWNGIWKVSKEVAPIMAPTNSQYSRQKTIADNRTLQSVQPLFCLSLYEHTWLRDYGILGKKEYVNTFWEHLDWERLTDAHSEVVRRDALALEESHKRERRNPSRPESALFHKY